MADNSFNPFSIIVLITGCLILGAFAFGVFSAIFFSTTPLPINGSSGFIEVKDVISYGSTGGHSHCIGFNGFGECISDYEYDIHAINGNEYRLDGKFNTTSPKNLDKKYSSLGPGSVIRVSCARISSDSRSANSNKIPVYEMRLTVSNSDHFFGCEIL